MVHPMVLDFEDDSIRTVSIRIAVENLAVWQVLLEFVNSTASDLVVLKPHRRNFHVREDNQLEFG